MTPRPATNATCRAPRLPALLLGWTAPARESGALFGDLDEEYEQFVRPSRGRISADLWYWRQVLSSIAPNIGRSRGSQASPPPATDPNGRSRPPQRFDMDNIKLDIRLALRALRARPGFAAVAIITLALGIGANTAIFSVVNGVLLRPLPYPEPQQLMTVWLDNRLQGWPQDVTSYPLYMDWRDQSRAFDDMSAWSMQGMNITGDGDPRRITGVQASPNLLELLGVEAEHGRVFSPADWDADPNVVVVSHAFWQARFGGDTGAVGRQIRLNDNAFTIIGVMPAGFDFGSPEVSYWRPFDPGVRDSSRGSLWLNVIGRLDAGVGVVAARDDMDRVGAQLEEELPETNTGYGVTVIPLLDNVVGDVSTALWVLLGAVGFVMLIACANVANMSLARASTRHSEMALRSALGADRGRLLRQMLTESLVLSLAGGAAGLAVAFWSLRGLQLLEADLPRLEGVGIDTGVLAFTAFVSVLTGVLFGIVPALRVSRPDLNEALKEGGRSAAGATGGKLFRQGLVATEIALALVLLVGAGLLIRSYAEIRNVDLGFEPDGLLMTTITLPQNSYPEPTDVYGFFNQLMEDVEAVPGVEATSIVHSVPLGPRFSSGFFTIQGRPPVPRDQLTEVKFNVASPGYFPTMRTPLLRGRVFEPEDSIDARNVVVINETMRRLYFPGEDPVGQQFLPGRPEGYVTEEEPNPELPWFEIIGVVADVPQRNVRQPAEPEVFFPYTEGSGGSFTLLARASGNASAIAGPVRAAVWDLDGDLPVANQGPISELVTDSSTQERLNFRLLSLFALLAMTLAGVGIYGVMSYTVSQRRREIGIRMALGASAADVRGAVLRRSLSVAAVGLVAGAVAAAFMTRFMTTLLFGVEPTDPLTFVMVTLTLATIALAASLIPAARAARQDPTTALRD